MRLTEENFMLMAMHNYDNCQLNTVDEFQHDINRIACVQKIIERYLKADRDDINLRLILNHCIILRNSFGLLVGDMFYLKLSNEYKSVIRPVLEYLNIIKKDAWSEIGYDMKIHIMLEKI